MKRILPLLLTLALTAALAVTLSACTAPNDLGGKIDTDLWEIEHRPDTEVPNQYPDGHALGGNEDHGAEGGAAEH